METRSEGARTNADERGVAVLIATKNREHLLRKRSLPSLERQTRAPELLVVVNDGAPLKSATLQSIKRVRTRDATTVIENSGPCGAAGAWNSGLTHLSNIGHHGYVAILDDDDEWDPEHLEVNWSASSSIDADGSVSGLRMCFNGVIKPRPMIGTLAAEDFLTGNPGWQGSNTFVKMEALAEAGRFRSGLQSCNDRDLAIRLLRLPKRKWILVPKWTATWHQANHPTLSTRGSQAKLEGLREFWSLYSQELSKAQQVDFFRLSESRFGFSKRLISGFECHHVEGNDVIPD